MCVCDAEIQAKQAEDILRENRIQSKRGEKDGGGGGKRGGRKGGGGKRGGEGREGGREGGGGGVRERSKQEGVMYACDK